MPDIKVEGDTAVVRGTKSLTVLLMATDLRASVSLVLAGPRKAKKSSTR